MIPRVEGHVVSLDALWSPVLNFGQFPWPAPLGCYELEFARSESLELLGPAYYQSVAELQADDSTSLHLTDSPLRTAGYPPLPSLLDHPAALLETVTAFLWDDLLGAILLFPPSPRACFMINSIDAVSASAAAVSVRGRGYHGAPGFAAKAKP